MRMNQEIESFLILTYFDFDIKHVHFDAELTEMSVSIQFLLKNKAKFLSD
jgi:hypothetical protein